MNQNSGFPSNFFIDPSFIGWRAFFSWFYVLVVICLEFVLTTSFRVTRLSIYTACLLFPIDRPALIVPAIVFGAMDFNSLAKSVPLLSRE